MIGERQLRWMKRGACLINNSRGSVVDLGALAAALQDKHLAGAAIDVFPAEPSSNTERFLTPLQGMNNVILTPHIGGSTEEAQQRIGTEVARRLLDFVDNGSTTGAVNFPQVQLIPRRSGARFVHVHQNRPGGLGRLNEVFARHGVNIAAQTCQTDAQIGYVVLDSEGPLADTAGVLDAARRLPGTIFARLLSPSGMAGTRVERPTIKRASTRGQRPTASGVPRGLPQTRQQPTSRRRITRLVASPGADQVRPMRCL
jgi:D-3-phosphoglycerate dehydrogenase